jgi:hypothetical protein
MQHPPSGLTRRGFGQWLCAQATVATALPLTAALTTDTADASTNNTTANTVDAVLTGNAPLSRAAFVATLANHFGWIHSSTYHDAYKNPQPTFSDVKVGETRWACQVEAALEAELMNNFAGEFRPEARVTRAEAAAFYAQGFGITAAAATVAIDAVLGKHSPEATLTGKAASRVLAHLTATVVAPPQVLCKAGTTAPRRYVQLMTATPDAKVHYTYTYDGSEPADPLSAAGAVYDLRNDGVLQFVNPLNSTTDYRLYRLKAVAVKDGLPPSAMREYAWNIVRPRTGDFTARLVQLGTGNSPTIWRIFNPAEYFQANVYYIEGTQRGLVFDAGEYGYQKGNLKTFIDTLARRPYDLVVGHSHPDHAEQIYNFTSAGIALHVSAQEKAAFMASQRTDWRAAGEAAVVIGEGHEFDLGNVQVTAFPMPGHTHGLTTILVNQTGQVYGSDMWGCNRPHTADTTQYQGVKVDLFLSLVQQVLAGYRRASTSGEITQVTNAHQEVPVGMGCVRNFERCFQQLVDGGNAVAQPSIRGGLKQGDRMSLVGDMWRDKDWIAIGPIGKFAAPVDYFTRPTTAYPCSANIDHNTADGYLKYSVLSSVAFEGAELVGVDVYWAAPANGVANRLPNKFDPWTYAYRVKLQPGASKVTLRAKTLSTRVHSMTIDGAPTAYDAPVTLAAQAGREVAVVVVAPDGTTSSRYTFTLE